MPMLEAAQIQAAARTEERNDDQGLAAERGTVLNWRWWVALSFLVIILSPIVIVQGGAKLLIGVAGATRNGAIWIEDRIDKIMSAPMKRLQKWVFHKTPSAEGRPR